LGKINWFTELKVNGDNTMFAIDENHAIFDIESLAWTLKYKPGTAGAGEGLICDQKNRLLYMSDQYLGCFDNATADYETGTVTATNGSPTVTGSGTTFVTGHAGKRIRFGTETTFYTIQTYVSATEVTLTTNYAGTTGSGKAYKIFAGWTDAWKDFVKTSITYRPADTYEDLVCIGNGNQLAVLFADDSFNANAFSLPSGFEIRCVKSGRTGILMGANINGRGVLVLWDGYSDRSIAPWIWFDCEIKAITYDRGNWIVLTSQELIVTNGYIAEHLAFLPDTRMKQAYYLINALPSSLATRDNYIFLNLGLNTETRLQSGIWVLDRKTGTWELIRYSSNRTYGTCSGALYVNSQLLVYVNHKTSLGTDYSYIDKIYDYSSPSAFIVSDIFGKNENNKSAEAVIVNLGFDAYNSSNAGTTYTISVKLYNFKRSLFNYANQKALATDYNKITVNATVQTLLDVQVGDEVTICEGANAGQVRHITAIAGDATATEIWTLDSALSNYMEANARMIVSPFQKVASRSVSNITDFQKERFFFNCKNKIQGKKYLVKVLVESATATTNYSTVEITGISLLYDDLGYGN